MKGSNVISVISFILKRPSPFGIKTKQPSPIGLEPTLEQLSSSVFPNHMILCPKLRKKFENMRYNFT